MKLEIKVKECKTCPCLRNTEYGFECFLCPEYNLHIIDVAYGEGYPDWCPALDENK